MSKAVMISIRPKWCEKIARGEKTIEVRKTRPKLETPFKCYIYRTKGTVPHIINDKWVQMEVGGTVIGEFTCDQIVDAWWDYVPDAITQEVTGGNLEALEGTGMTDGELFGYVGDSLRGHCYGWHISGLKIYDNLKELGEFSRPFENCIDKVCDEFGCASCENGGHIKRPPQSWCYVEEQK